MKKLFSLLIVAVVFMSCTAEDTSPQYLYSDMYEKGANMDKTAVVNIEFETTYKNVQVSVYDVEAKKILFVTNDSKFNINLDLTFYGRYIFEFQRVNGELITPQDEPYTFIHIKNLSDNKLIDEMEYEGCLLGYNNSFIAW
jgi:PBP1b-binding outer membrane lipoprotein LpoB